MTPATFIRNFDLLAEAPGGVPKLRELILQLAVRGKLVPQDPKNKPVKLGGASAAESVDASVQMPEFVIPSQWVWTRLDDVIDYNYGEKTDSEQIPADAWLLDLEDIEKETSRLLKRVLAGDRQSTSTKSRFSAGDVLYGKLRPYERLPHYMAELCEKTENDEPRRHLFLYVVLASLASDTVSAVRRLLRGSQKAKFVEMARQYRERVESIWAQCPPWVVSKLRALIANLYVV